MDLPKYGGVEGRHRQASHRRRRVSVRARTGSTWCTGRAEFLSATASWRSPPRTSRIEIDFESAGHRDRIAADGASHGFPHDGEKVIGSTEALSLQAVPERFVVIGAGYIGLELGMRLRQAGVARCRSSSSCPRADSQPRSRGRHGAEPVSLKQLKIVKLHLSHHGADRFEAGDPSMVVVAGDRRTRSCGFEADVVMMSVGRLPNSDSPRPGCGIGVETDDKGFINCQRPACRPGVPGNLRHRRCGGRRRCWPTRPIRRPRWLPRSSPASPRPSTARPIPAVIYTDPEVAWTGLSETGGHRAGVRGRHRHLSRSRPPAGPCRSRLHRRLRQGDR